MPDIVVTDIHLPDGSGFDLLKSLRDDPHTSRIPVVAVTADAMRTNMDMMRDAGFDSIVTKPFKVPTLIDALQTVLKAPA